MKANYQHQIEAYLSGEMSPDQLDKFEVELESNPELNQELNFQSEIIQGIGEYRKVELTTRLDALKVPSAWWSFVQNSTTLQYLGGTLIAASIGAGIWFGVRDDSEITEPSVGSSVVIDSPNRSLVEWNSPVEWNLPEPITKNAKKEMKSVRSENTSELAENKKKETVREKTQSFNPVVSVPLAGDVQSEKNFVPEEVGEPSAVMANSSDRPISVEIVDSKTLNVKYSYYDGKLFLYGKFRQQPYEILEINSAKQRKIYLYHLDTFYQILPSDKPVNLQVVTNTRLIQELTILRKTK